MNKKLLKSKKGFTIVELVIVIAVIAILAAVLIPTFVNVTEKAKESAALTDAKNAYTLYLSENVTDDNCVTDCVLKSGDYYFTVADGQLNTTGTKTGPTSGYDSGTTITDTNVTMYKPTTTEP